MNSDVQITGRRHQQRSVDGYNRLPDEFTLEDVKRSFGYTKDNSATVKVNRLMDQKLIEKVETEDGYKYKKIAQSIR